MNLMNKPESKTRSHRLSVVFLAAGTILASGPLLGLVAFVHQMILTFRQSAQNGAGDPKLLSGGIAEGIVFVEQGLVLLTLAVPLLAFGHFIRFRRASDAENAVSEIAEFWTCLLSLVLIGGLGAHQFYAKRRDAWWHLLTLGGLGILTVVDLVKLGWGVFKDGDGKFVRLNWKSKSLEDRGPANL